MKYELDLFLNLCIYFFFNYYYYYFFYKITYHIKYHDIFHNSNNNYFFAIQDFYVINCHESDVIM